VIQLGEHTPLFSYAEAVNRFDADLACVSITMTDNIERAARDYEGLRRAAAKRGARIVMGGAALEDNEVRARFRGAFYAPTLQEFLGLISQSN
jgi:methanogenic corrinoid protein MtbC1